MFLISFGHRLLVGLFINVANSNATLSVIIFLPSFTSRIQIAFATQYAQLRIKKYYISQTPLQKGMVTWHEHAQWDASVGSGAGLLGEAQRPRSKSVAQKTRWAWGGRLSTPGLVRRLHGLGGFLSLLVRACVDSSGSPWVLGLPASCISIRFPQSFLSLWVAWGSLN